MTAGGGRKSGAARRLVPSRVLLAPRLRPMLRPARDGVSKFTARHAAADPRPHRGPRQSVGGERVTARTRILDVMWNGSPVAPQLDLISKPNSKLATGGGPLSGDRRIHYIRTDIRGNLVKETECSTAATVRQPRKRYRFSARRVSLSAQTLEETSAVSRGPAVVAKGAKPCM